MYTRYFLRILAYIDQIFVETKNALLHQIFLLVYNAVLPDIQLAIAILAQRNHKIGDPIQKNVFVAHTQNDLSLKILQSFFRQPNDFHNNAGIHETSKNLSASDKKPAHICAEFSFFGQSHDS